MVCRDIPMANFNQNISHGLYARNSVMMPQTLPYGGTTSTMFCDGMSAFLAWHRQNKVRHGNNGDFHLHL